MTRRLRPGPSVAKAATSGRCTRRSAVTEVQRGHEVARHAQVAHGIGPVGREADLEGMVGAQAQVLRCGHAHLGSPDPAPGCLVRGAQPELVLRADHAMALDPADLGLLDGELRPVGRVQRAAHGGHQHLLTGRHVRRPQMIWAGSPVPRSTRHTLRRSASGCLAHSSTCPTTTPASMPFTGSTTSTCSTSSPVLVSTSAASCGVMPSRSARVLSQFQEMRMGLRRKGGEDTEAPGGRGLSSRKAHGLHRAQHPAVLPAHGAELAWSWWSGRKVYRFNDFIANLGCGIGSQVVGAFTKTSIFAAYLYVWDHWRLFTVGNGALAWVGAFLLVDLLYYWFHRASHEVNAFWAAHVVHHQSEEYNLSVALRQSWFQGLISWWFYLPMAWLGFHPLTIVTVGAFNTLYQFWIHTKAIGSSVRWNGSSTRPATTACTTAATPKYIDRNHAGTLIIWDKLFGTFQEEEEEPVYGITKPLASWDPVTANFRTWRNWAPWRSRPGVGATRSGCS